MASNAETAEQIIRIFAVVSVRENRVWMTYKALAEALGRPGQQRLLQGALDVVRDICRDRGLPDLAVCIVSEDSVKAGTLLPASGAIQKYGGIPAIRRAQAEVLCFDWAAYRF
ncbi:hypothetical protein [Limimaricola pyoseonensis]|uniref:hypothetical protein n=1 Tax=Limimaricola pyoseonensis TaxID=521013 RepID=UPI000B7ED924|nr:hypothetical protein [Limimaricola pyoseonensis]